MYVKIYYRILLAINYKKSIIYARINQKSLRVSLGFITCQKSFNSYELKIKCGYEPWHWLKKFFQIAYVTIFPQLRRWYKTHQSAWNYIWMYKFSSYLYYIAFLFSNKTSTTFDNNTIINGILYNHLNTIVWSSDELIRNEMYLI